MYSPFAPCLHDRGLFVSPCGVQVVSVMEMKELIMKASFRSLAGYKLFHQFVIEYKKCDNIVFVPLRGASCFLQMCKSATAVGRFRPLAGYKLFQQKDTNCVSLPKQFLFTVYQKPFTHAIHFTNFSQNISFLRCEPAFFPTKIYNYSVRFAQYIENISKKCYTVYIKFVRIGGILWSNASKRCMQHTAH